MSRADWWTYQVGLRNAKLWPEVFLKPRHLCEQPIAITAHREIEGHASDKEK